MYLPRLPVRFQSTLPVRGATAFPFRAIFFIVISIHAPREGSDLVCGPQNIVQAISIHARREGSDLAKSTTRRVDMYFNPRSP